MIKSMTAFARHVANVKESQWSIEIRCVNHRFMDFSLKAPYWCSPHEDEIRQWIASKLQRGKISLSINVKKDKGQAENFAIDDAMVAFYISSAEKIKKKHKLVDSLQVHQILSLPKVLVSEERQDDETQSLKTLKKLVQEALKDIVVAREVEGKKLAKDMVERLGVIEKTLAMIQKQTANSVEDNYERLKNRVDQLLSDEKIALDQERIHKEIAILSEKSDITEEIVRLKSHIELFRQKMKPKEEVGREMDFLCQEMHREINTIGSKSQYFQISTSVINMKKELEKIREQVQNIE